MIALFDEILDFWNFILTSDENFSKKDAREKLLDYADRISLFKGVSLSIVKVDIYEIVFNYLRIVEASPDNNESLKVTAIIFNKKDEPVYYIYDKTLLKDFAIKNNWFFSSFRKTETITESEFFMLIKDNEASNLAYLANIILDKDKKVIFQRANQGNWAQGFFNTIKED